jgi:hypothetical protein
MGFKWFGYFFINYKDKSPAMKPLLRLIFLLLATPAVLKAQTLPLTTSPGMVWPVDSSLRPVLLASLNELIRTKTPPQPPLRPVDSAYGQKYPFGFGVLENVTYSKAQQDSFFFKPRLTNVIKLREGAYLLKIAFIGSSPELPPMLRMVYCLIAQQTGAGFEFYPAISHLTARWQRKKVGNVSYVYPHTLNRPDAEKFNRFNTMLAARFGVATFPLTYYQCTDAQDALRIRGVDYSSTADYMKSGDGDEMTNTLISGEDTASMAHDLVHFYCAKFLPQPTNRLAEEGLAYFLGGCWDASYAGCVDLLRQYAAANPDLDLYEIFKKGYAIRSISMKRTMCGLICEELIRQRGFEVVLKLIQRANTDAAYLEAVNELQQINPQNFNQKIRKMLSAAG